MTVLLTSKRLKPRRYFLNRLVLDKAVIVSYIDRRGSKTPRIDHVMIFSRVEKYP